MSNIENQKQIPYEVQAAMHTLDTAQQGFGGSFWPSAVNQAEINGINPIPNPGKWLRNAHERTNPKGLLAATTLTTLSSSLISVDVVFSPIIHTVQLNQVDLNPLKFAAAALAGIASISEESKALETHKYSANITSTVLYEATGHPSASALIGQLLGQAANPVVLGALTNSDHQLAIDVGLTAWVISSIWNFLVNRKITDGSIDPFIEKAKPFTDKVSKIKDSLLRRNKRSKETSIGIPEEN